MNRFIFVLLFMSLNCWSNPRTPLTFEIKSSITSAVLDYKITNVNFVPDSLYLQYDKDTEAFVSVDLALVIDTNIPTDEPDSFLYSLVMIENSSECFTRDDEFVDSLPPSVSINDTPLILDTPLSSMSFDDESGGFLSDKNDVKLIFNQLDKSIEKCSGDISVEVGVDI
ncbi:hypothetical protein [Photobacterium profundum]|uniref:hypothetical protein n=1 Tax=Photobacterium profundum TaxID=74109 RepID=UPI003D0A8920